MNIRKTVLFIVIATFGSMFIGFGGNAHAYVGPGAGFAFLSSFFILFITFALALFYFLSWPFRFIVKSLFNKRPKTKGGIKRIVVIGLDGMDPKLADDYMKDGILPNFQKLKENGTFTPLSTSYPSISPVAWSSFMTGVDTSYHNIYDFLTRDPCTYLPMLSSAEIGKASKILPIGKYMIPLGKPLIKLLRKSKPFWKILGEHGIFSSIIRVPVTFPPEEFNGVLLSGMCVPDLKGSQGTFTFYTSNRMDNRIETGGIKHFVSISGNKINAELYGPENSFVKGGMELKIPFTITLDREGNKAQISLTGQRFELKPKIYSPWIKVVFRPGLGVKIHGICRFYINRISPEFDLYVSPIHIDPEKPALPISHPFVYSIYMAKLIGSYGTLGLAEDTWALNEEVLDEEAFLKQAYLFYEEREKMFFEALERTRKGLCTCVFDTTDRIQHMFFRYLDPGHPSNKGKEKEVYKHVIRDLYIRMDNLIGKVMEKIDKKTILIVMSDHGFAQFKRGVNLNTWLFKNGYLVLKEKKTISRDWFKDVDWEKSLAFSLGLTGIFINRKGREVHGVVEEGAEFSAIKRKLIDELTGLKDEETGDIAIRRVIDTEEFFSGPYTYDGPDLLIGYNPPYRSSWDCVTGRVTASIFTDNTRHWSGDHCVDPEMVPGVLFVNKKIKPGKPDIKDIAPTVLNLFGVEIPEYMKGNPFLGLVENSEEKEPRAEK